MHFAKASDEQLGRVARLGALVSGSPYYVSMLADRYGKDLMGAESADTMVRLGSAARDGIPISLHSDMPMAPARPLYLAWCAANRITSSGRVAAPQERLSIEHALRAVTIDAAYSVRLEQEMGSIAPGKVANFTVLEEDPLTVDPSRLKDLVIWGTVFEGRIFKIQR